MASIVDVNSGLPILELGPGTGVITKAILDRGVSPENLFSVEYSQKFITHLQTDFPSVNFIQGDAFDVKNICKSANADRFDCVISGLPLLNFPSEKRVRLIDGLLDHLPPGRPIIQFCYGPFSPVLPGRGNYEVEHFNWVARNVPPAQLWIYRRY